MPTGNPLFSNEQVELFHSSSCASNFFVERIVMVRIPESKSSSETCLYCEPDR